MHLLVSRAAGAMCLLAAALGNSPAAAVDLSDSLALFPGRKAGQSLAEVPLEKGSQTWSTDGSIVLGPDGATSARDGGGTAFHPLPAALGIHRLTAEICPAGLNNCCGLALFGAHPAGNFFRTAEVMFLFTAGGGYEIDVKGQGTVRHGSKADYPDFLPHGFNRLELICNALSNTLEAKLNGRTVLANHALPENSSRPLFLYAGVRFNGPLTPGVPKVRNYAVTVIPLLSAGFVPVDRSDLFFAPRAEVALRFRVESRVAGAAVPFAVSDYQGRNVLRGQAGIDADDACVVKLNLPRGYYELTFPASRETWGLVALERAERADPFFCIDASLTWLELDPQRRAALLKILARCGIAMARERLGLALVNPLRGKYTWDEGRRMPDRLRSAYAQNQVPILELLDGRARHHGISGDSPYPQNLAEMAAAWTEVARHWQGNWGGAEVCNEPDLKVVPAEQYVVNAKAMSYALAQAHASAPLVAGVFARLPPGPFFDACVANGMLADAQAVSFHSYDRASDVEGMIVRYRRWLRQAGAEAMPLWQSECGWAWTNGPGRPPRAEDGHSALEIAAKAMESRACGVARHFPFVYVYYEEGPKNFGMLGREASPLRSMAAYAMCARTLAGRRYLGDLTGLAPAVRLARVFAGAAPDDCVAVLYTGQPDAEVTLTLPCAIRSAAGIDGRELPVTAGRLTLPDGLAYVWLDASRLGDRLQTDTPAARLYALGQQPWNVLRRASPIVLQFLASQTPARVSARRYIVTRETARALPVHVRVHNLGDVPVAAGVQLQLPGAAAEAAQNTTVPARGASDVAWTLDATQRLDIARTRFITVQATTSGIAPTPLAIPLVMDGSLEQHLARHSRQRPLPITDLNRWTANIAGHGKSKISVTPDGWRMDVSFAGNHGNWSYPKFALPQRLDPAVDGGFVLRARVGKPADGIAILASTGQPGGVGFWATDLFPADGTWHVVYIPFGEFQPGPNQTGNQNTRLDPAAWSMLSIGLGSRVAENALQVSDWVVVGGAEGD